MPFFIGFPSDLSTVTTTGAVLAKRKTAVNDLGGHVEGNLTEIAKSHSDPLAQDQQTVNYSWPEDPRVSTWNDHERWTALCSGDQCPICCQQEPLDVIAALETSWVTMQEFAPVRGYVCLVSRSHAVELHDLTQEAAAAFMRDAQRVSKSLSAATGAVKLNYEIHGNSLPHLHMHFFPRYRGDRFEGKPIDPKSVSGPVYAAGEFQRLRDSLLLSLGTTGQ